ncbi:MAG TPA: UDP-N-acetylglucosamine 1-carboxyvinyltransferase [Candidatus Hydrogenedentes bacterium]|nr:UDP-N-acetylglucosamine 1-carboxyvinyltransferase [Candidatus Hydrogenedentota bacterium]HPG67409.1 UDP-N-acetylglucosamine 1-carboxyvinyltransferase [Candidatus Hydrogenedentota bacterium]
MALDKIRIQGGTPLRGNVPVRGAKNSTLPLMAAAVLVEERTTLRNVPALADIDSMARLLESMGVVCRRDGRCLEMDATAMTSHEAHYDLVRKMRASFFVLGPLLARFGRAKVSLPGGCAIGTRPVDIHLKGLEALGAKIRIDEGYVIAEGRLRGANIALDFPSVGATENLMMAAARAEGPTRLTNVAHEPEIVDLAAFLNQLGARVEGAGSDLIAIEGVPALTGTDHTVIPDRIEAGTLLLAGVATHGEVRVEGACAAHLPSFLEKLEAIGAEIAVGEDWVQASALNGLKAVDLITGPFPGFPTDLQAQTMAVLCLAEGASVIKETVFENRFMQVAELRRMGANIEIDGNSAVVRGVPYLSGAPLMASDLRASAALVIAALAAERGETVISRVYHLDRGYECIEERLAALGGTVERIEE